MVQKTLQGIWKETQRRTVVAFSVKMGNSDIPKELYSIAVWVNSSMFRSTVLSSTRENEKVKAKYI